MIKSILRPPLPIQFSEHCHPAQKRGIQYLKRFLDTAFTRGMTKISLRDIVLRYSVMLLLTFFSLSATADKLDCASTVDQLVNVNVNYWGFDQKLHSGTLVVNKTVEPDIISIFQTLYQAKFPIAKIQPVSFYQDDETKAMADNDTFAFSCRFMTGNSQFISKHAYGLAIDINPLINPYVRGKVVLPVAGKKYLHRSSSIPGMIVNNDIVVHTFEKYGWIWGGNWKSIKDYQHFEKD